MTNKEKIAYFVISCILFIILVIIGSLAIIKQNEYNLCLRNPVPYCYNDWKCLDPTDLNKEIDMSQNTLYDKSGLIHKCSPLSQENTDTFEYIDEFGVNQTKHPSTERNIWDLNPECQSNIINNCPDRNDPNYDNCVAKHSDKCEFYGVGNIYWPACSGNKTSQYYTKPSIYNSLHVSSKLLHNNIHK